MNLKLSIKKILKEEINQIRVRRLLHIVEDYIKNLSPDEVCRYWKSHEEDDYVNESMSEVVRFVMYEFPDITHEDWSQSYDEVYDIIVDYGYQDLIKEFFTESISNCKSTLKEETKIPLNIRRRLHVLDDLLYELIGSHYTPNNICVINRNSQDFIDQITYNVITQIYYWHFEHIDDTSDEWKSLYTIMEEYLVNKYGEKLREYYHINCGD